MGKLAKGSALVALTLGLLGAVGCGEDGKDAAGGAGEPDAGAEADGALGASSADGLHITLEDGELEGDLSDGVRRFLKIPFAKPPRGELRWQAPQKNDGWQGVRHEPDFSAPCPQAMSSQIPEPSYEEDCLYLNVWAPEDPPAKAPVMVWFHGGGNTTGSAGDREPVPGLDPSEQPLWYDGQQFAERHGVIVVSSNYRLGAFGFFAHPALVADGSPAGNQGLLDQQRALEWVRDNIAAFGGDPENVTIFGESAGSADVCMHVVSPRSRGLFHRAVSQSGGCTLRRVTASSDDQTAGIEQFASELGCGGADALACLREASVQDIVELAARADLTSGEVTTTPWRFAPVIDGPDGFLPDSPAALFEAGEVAEVPYILGSNTDEGTLFFLGATPPANDEEYLAALTARFGELAPEVAEQYAVSKFDGDYRIALATAWGDSGLVCGTHDTARRAVAAGLPVFMYNFNVPWNLSPAAATLLGATHAAEISHVFGHPYLADAESQAVSDAMNAYWAAFARSGDPNFEGAPAEWPAFEPDAADDDLRLQFDPAMQVLESYRKEECAFWRELLGG